MTTARFLECRVVATANLTVSAPRTIDGVGLAAGDQVLSVAQSAAYSGIFEQVTCSKMPDASTSKQVTCSKMPDAGTQEQVTCSFLLVWRRTGR